MNLTSRLAGPVRAVAARASCAAGAFSRHDPTLFLFSFAAWMALNAASLLAPGRAFDASPLYALARELGLPETLTGLLMLLNAMALLWCLGLPRPRVQAWLALVTGGLWCFWALLMFFSGLRVHLFSATATWNVVAALALLQTSHGPAARASDAVNAMVLAADAPPAAASAAREASDGW